MAFIKASRRITDAHASGPKSVGRPTLSTPSSIDSPISRRRFVQCGLVAAATAAVAVGCSSPLGRHSGGIIDTHTHFYDPKRPEGVEWPPVGDPILYRPILPDEFRSMAVPLGVEGTVVIEASPKEEDNGWVLQLAERHQVILGVIGFLKPGQPGFSQKLARFGANPLFKGIRVGGWGVPVEPRNPPYVRDLAELAERGLVLDVIVGPDELSRVADLAAALPRLPMIINHVGNLRIDGATPPAAWLEGMRACSKHPHVHCKLSGLVEGAGQAIQPTPRELSHYIPVLNELWKLFGSERMIFGSNWPVSARFADYGSVLSLAREFLSSRGPEAEKRCLSENARRFYRLSSRHS